MDPIAEALGGGFGFEIAAEWTVADDEEMEGGERRRASEGIEQNVWPF